MLIKTNFILFFFFLTVFLSGYAQEVVGVNTTDPKTTLDVNGNLSLRAGTALNLNAGNNNISVGSHSFYNISGPSGSFNINQISSTANVDGQIITLVNTTSNLMTIVNNDGANLNSIATINGANISLAGIYSTVTLQYNFTLQRWVVVRYSDNGNYGRSIYSVVGTTDTQTDLTTFSDMASMSITFVPKKSVVYVNVGMSGHMSFVTNTPQGYADFRLVNVNNNSIVAGITTVCTDIDSGGGASSWVSRMMMVPVTVVPGQSTTLKIQWRRQGQNPSTLFCLANSTAYSHRNITIFD